MTTDLRILYRFNDLTDLTNLKIKTYFWELIKQPSLVLLLLL